MMHKNFFVSSFVALLVSPSILPAQRADSSFDLSIKNIMRGPELYGRVPQDVRWSADSRWIYFTWAPPGTSWKDRAMPYRVRAVPGAKPEKITLAQRDSAGAYTSATSLSPDRKRGVTEFDGDLYVVDFAKGSVRRLTHTLARESSPVFSADARTIYFARDGNAFAFDLASGLVTQLTDLRPGIEPADTTPKSPQRTRLMEQQRALFDAVRERVASDTAQKLERNTLDSIRGPRPVWLGRDRNVFAANVSPNGRGVLVFLRIPSKGTQVEVPFWITESGYTDPRKTRTKVGDAQAHVELIYVSLPDGKVTHLHPFASDTSSSFVAFNGWNQSGSDALFFAYSADNKDRILYALSSTDASMHAVETLHDTAWVGGPCTACAGWYDNGRRVWYVSEKTGFSHLYTSDARGGDTRALTSGRWEVRDADLSQDGRSFVLTTNDPSPTEEHLFTLPVNGGALTKITSRSGKHSALVSPDGRLVADVYSTVKRPPDLYVMSNRAGAPESELTRSPSDEFLRGPWIAPQLVMIPASDGARVPAHLFRPEDVGARPNGAAVIFVHGAGYLHNVGNFWKEAYPREYMFNHFLAKHGYVVIDADYRASDGYGRDWRTAIYRYMGGRDLQDEVDASKYLTATYHVPPNRIGMYGGSYGGFMTLMALFTAPDYFGAGAALRSVTDWAHYNNGYTSGS